jgi:uncharacterized protein with HEPN domain
MKDYHIESLKRLQFIDNAIDVIEKYIVNEDAGSFSKNNLLQDAVLFQFSVMGEAIKHVEAEKLAKYDYPWHKVRSFRNMIAHEYFNIKMIAVWDIIINDLPELKAIIKEMLKNEF